MTGSTILHYRIIEELGRGGMGTVYKAEDTKLNNFVALKFLPPELSRDEEAKQRFLNEARSARRLEHPNICTIYDIDETEEGQIFISMPFYEGGTLEEKIAQGPLSVHEAVEIATRIAEALSKAHKEGIVHRDIKPSNIMFTLDGAVKVVDFGLAKVAGVKMTRSGTTMGTLAYMSPEQLRGDPTDHRTDIWALGVILYEMLTSRHPFQAEHEQSMFYRILNEPADPLAEDIPSTLIQIVRKSMEKDPADRYRDVDELVRELNAMTIKTGAETKLSKIDRPAKRPLIIVGVFSILVVLIIIAIILLSPPEKETNSIAVLPLRNLSGEQSQEYFADGITEELIATLGKIKKLKVISFTSVLRYRNSQKSIPEIANELGVKNIVEGSVQTHGERIRVTAKLIEASPERLLWSSEPYDREMANVFALTNEVARSIAQEIKLVLTPEEREKLDRSYAVNSAAYRHYLHGRYQWNKRTPQSIMMSMDYFQQAVEEDPNLAPAYSGLADALALLGSIEYGVYPPKEVMPKAREAALTAIQLDPLLAEAHTSLANVHLFYDWDWNAAEERFERAIQLNPNYATARHWYADYFVAMGKFNEAIKEINTALDLDPNSLVINTEVGWIHQHSRKYDVALEQLQTVIKLEPDFINAHLAIGFTCALQDMMSEAIKSFRKAEELSDGYPLSIASLGYALALSGQRNQALQLLSHLNDISQERYVPALYYALIYIGLGELDRTFEWIDKALEERAGYLVYFNVDPKVDGLRSDPRFEQLIKRIGL